MDQILAHGKCLVLVPLGELDSLDLSPVGLSLLGLLMGCGPDFKGSNSWEGFGLVPLLEELVDGLDLDTVFFLVGTNFFDLVSIGNGEFHE